MNERGLTIDSVLAGMATRKDDAAVVRIMVKISNRSEADRTELLVAQVNEDLYWEFGDVVLRAHGAKLFFKDFRMDNPAIWDLATGATHSLTISIADLRYQAIFGLRSVALSESGVLLNDALLPENLPKILSLNDASEALLTEADVEGDPVAIRLPLPDFIAAPDVPSAPSISDLDRFIRRKMEMPGRHPSVIAWAMPEIPESRPDAEILRTRFETIASRDPFRVLLKDEREHEQ